MATCTPAPRVRDLSVCSVGPYGQGLLHVGTVAATPGGTVVFFKNLATGFVHMAECDPAEHPEIVVELPQDLSPDQVYEVSVLGTDTSTGIAVLPFTVFTYEQSTGTWIDDTTTYEAVHVRFFKAWNTGLPNQYTEQWLNL